jgi:TPP-dependent pyruvate/acetoin dehydrogenase alpha subunit
VSVNHDLALLHSMLRIRAVEEAIAANYPRGLMRCPTHLSIGQEAAAVGVCAALTHHDRAVSGHRAHAHYLAKGGDLTAMLAEIHGRVTGCARGKGGSMHLIDESVGFMGSTAIVGGTVPVGVGLALAAQVQNEDRVVVVFLGDAVLETGVFHEAANFAVVRRLPVLFACENNLYSVYSPLSVRQPEGRTIHALAAAHGLRATLGDGNDVRATEALVGAAVSRIRAGGGPEFIELSTYRWREHCGPNFDNDIGYRTETEYEAWRAQDPIARFSTTLMAEGALDDAALTAMRASIDAEVMAAFATAEAAPFPAPEEAAMHLYVDA